VVDGAHDFCVVIPARYGASRLPGKPLRLLAGRPMIAHVWERAVESGARRVLVATDDERIREAVEAFGGTALMTSPDHPCGTDRLAEVAEREGWSGDEILVNLQGDEPCMDAALVRLVAAALRRHSAAGMATAATPIRAPRDLFDPSVVKVIVDDAHMASYFSRAPIPWVRDLFGDGRRPPKTLPTEPTFLRHLGLYAYRAAALRRLCAAAPRPCERAESLEQLRAIAMGIAVHVSIVEHAPGHGVDTEADLARVERALAGAGSGGEPA
jgi:3-deoxy-manno-octulosonate cytidylyltransferase (CMP-KDO synthetase)